ncbi:MAG: TPM domain-containing protein [Candidatus Omnitrophota bacterium]
MVKLDKKDRKEIEKAIDQAEDLTSGEIRVHVQSRSGGDVLKDAQKTFIRLKMHRTRERNGVLIFIALKTRTFAILGDREIHARVGGDAFWNATRDIMASYFAKNEVREGILAGVLSAGKELGKHFPSGPGDRNELPDTVTEE